MKTRWYLDVDGVLNASHHQPGYRRVNVFAIDQTYPIRYSQILVERIAKMSETIDIIWCTTWMNWANETLASALGLPQFPIVEPFGDGDDVSVGSTWWKYRRVNKALNEGHRVVWTDDDISDTLLKGVNSDPNGLAIRPHYNRGLTNKHLDEIEEFAKE